MSSKQDSPPGDNPQRPDPGIEKGISGVGDSALEQNSLPSTEPDYPDFLVTPAEVETPPQQPAPPTESPADSSQE